MGTLSKLELEFIKTKDLCLDIAVVVSCHMTGQCMNLSDGFRKGHNMLSQKIMKIQHSNSNFCGLKVRELNVEAAKLTSSHPNAAQDIEWKRHELEEAWANLREQVFNVIK